jgi:hypothetical protein
MNIVSIDTRERLLKTFTVLTAVATILMLSGVAYLAPTALGATPSDYGLKEGDLISAAGSDDPDVYIVNEHGYKRLFLNPVIFGFYGHLGGFSAVKNVSPVVRDAFPTSGLFRNCEMNDPAVYAVEVTGEDTGMLHWVNMSGQQAVSEDPNFFKKVFCINNNEFNWYWKGTDYTSLSQVPNYSRTPGQGQQQTGSLSATLASDNPASGTLIANQALADLAHFQVNGSGMVTSVELKRLGVSGDTTLSNVYLFVNGVRVSDAGNVSSGMVTFNNPNGLFNAPAVLVVKSDILSGTSGQTVGVQLTKLNNNAVSVSGNVHTIAATPTTFATVAVGSATGPGAFDPANDVNVWQSTFTVGSNEVLLKRLTLREIGSIDNKDVRNLRLFVDGVQVASDPDLDADGYATFLTNTRLLTGGRTVKVVADVVGGSGRNMQFSLRGAYDLEVLDEDYNVGVKPTGTFPVNPASSNVGTASVSVIKAPDSPSGDVVDGANDVSLAKFTVTAYGEAVKVETFTVLVTTSDANVGSLRNGRVLINGAQYGSTLTLTTAPGGTLFTVNYTFQPGVATTVEVKADVYDNDGTDHLDANDTITVTLGAGSNNGQGVTSANMLAVPGSNQAANILTVKSGSASLAKYTAYANQTVVVPKSSLKLGHYVLTGGSAEDINVNSIDVGFNGNDQWTASKLSNVYVKVTNSSGGLVVQTSPKSSVSPSASSSYSVNFTLPKSTSYHIEVWGSVDSFTVAGSDDTMATKLSVSGTSNQSSGTITTSVVVGQTLTADTGSIVSGVSGSNPAAKLVAANSTSTAAAFDFTATNDDFTLYELVFDLDNGTSAAAAVANVVLKDGSSVVASAPLNGASVSFTGLSILVPANNTKTLSVDLQYGNVGVGGATTGQDAKLNLESFKARDSVGTITTNATERQGNSMYVHRSYPTVAAVNLPSSLLAGGSQTLSKFNLTANGNTVGVKKLVFTITKDSTTALASASTTNTKIFVDGTDLTSVASIAGASIGAGQTSGQIVVEFNSEQQVSGGTSKTFELKHTVSSVGSTGTVVTALNVGTSSAASPASYATVDGTSAKLVWTDRSASGHSETTSDWMNDYLVKDSISQALTK